MENLRRFCFSIVVFSILIQLSCDQLSNETYHHLTPEERRKQSANYTQLAKRLERGSPTNMRLLEKALRLNPSNDQAHYELSLPYLYNGLFEKWHFHSSKAIELNPQAWQVWQGFNKLFYLRDFGGALFDLDATDTLTVDQTDYAQNMSVDYLRGLCYLGLKNYDKAKEYFTLYSTKEGAVSGDEYVDENAYVYLGLIENRLGRYKEAIEFFDRATRHETGLADVYYHKAYSLFQMKHIAEAKKELSLASKKFEEGKYMRGFNYETLEQIYKSDLEDLEKLIFASTQ